MTEAPNFFARRVIGNIEEFARGEHPLQQPDDRFSVQLALGATEVLTKARVEDVERTLGLACLTLEINKMGLRGKINPDLSPEGVAGLLRHHLEQQVSVEIGNGVVVRGNQKLLEQLEFLKPQ